MKARITPSAIGGSINVPVSKSAMQRACAAALIRKGLTVLKNPGTSADDLAALNIIQQLGAKVSKVDDTIEIESRGVDPISDEVHCGESGLSARMFTSIAALSKMPLTITGSGSLLKRPFSFFETTFPNLQVSVETNNGLLPVKIKGPLKPSDIEIDGQLSSQFLTGLLFAYAAAEAQGVSISVNGLNSKPYIDLSLQV
ncbi:MAG: 3-phosphoshikimate 1-carboxyvinyltransferase, partial [Flavisolibacter sp.]